MKRYTVQEISNISIGDPELDVFDKFIKEDDADNQTKTYLEAAVAYEAKIADAKSVIMDRDITIGQQLGIIDELVELLEEVLDKGRITWQRKVEDAINKHKGE